MLNLILGLLLLAGLVAMALDWRQWFAIRGQVINGQTPAPEQPGWARLAQEYAPLLGGLLLFRLVLAAAGSFTLTTAALAALIVSSLWWLLEVVGYRQRRPHQPSCEQNTWGALGEWLPPMLVALVLLLMRQWWPLALLAGAALTGWLVPQLKHPDPIKLRALLDNPRMALFERLAMFGLAALVIVPFTGEPVFDAGGRQVSGLFPPLEQLLIALALILVLWWVLGVAWRRWLHGDKPHLEPRWWHNAGAGGAPIIIGLALFNFLVVQPLSHFDFGALLAGLAVVLGILLLAERFWLRPRRMAKAAKAHQTQTAAYPRPASIDLAASLFGVVLVVLVLRQFVVEPFRIPSASMMPTLLSGDFILVNKFTYGLRLPVTETEILPLGKPKRGDVIVFRYPQDKTQDYIKRVVGLPGDTVKTDGRRIIVNGQQVPQKLIGDYDGPHYQMGRANLPLGDMKVGAEKLGEREHLFMVHARSPGIGASVTVPDGHYFVMGDNRDFSQDGRSWGFVPEDNVVGRAFFIWMNFDPEVKWPLFERIGSTIK